jgi:hypothetical protein
MEPIADLDAGLARRVRAFFTDIDGTLTDDGKLTASAFAALWRLRDAGIRVVPVTGRPAGWCDLIARQWPVDGVVGENGALAFWERDRKLSRLLHPAVANIGMRQNLDLVRDAVLDEVPGSRVARDQPYRMFDLAIDFREEPPDLGLAVADRIKAIFERFGAHAKISDIHVNGWFGDYDKLSMAKLYAREVWCEELEARREDYLFCGDSGNDEPMFAFFPNATAVANIEDFVAQLSHLPRFVASRSGGAGFVEIVDVLLDRRR